MPGFDILYEDTACLVVNKAAGLLTQAPLGIDSLEFRIKRFLQESATASRATSIWACRTGSTGPCPA